MMNQSSRESLKSVHTSPLFFHILGTGILYPYSFFHIWVYPRIGLGPEEEIGTLDKAADFSLCLCHYLILS